MTPGQEHDPAPVPAPKGAGTAGTGAALPKLGWQGEIGDRDGAGSPPGSHFPREK